MEIGTNKEGDGGPLRKREVQGDKKVGREKQGPMGEESYRGHPGITLTESLGFVEHNNRVSPAMGNTEICHQVRAQFIIKWGYKHLMAVFWVVTVLRSLVSMHL
ncbi:hypothetical protein RHSIM_Rhsim03G0025200 [Rhododendron simsii]|uniref:Uncharacterized protein n=1 Tax=Rhododendron simsii TaxID=118357 RepID=A0A834H9W3_RHOSS|nr:hypothetical protein RHSIM_Rhsim03G0025200 [Rhododendron simsii]